MPVLNVGRAVIKAESNASTALLRTEELPLDVIISSSFPAVPNYKGRIVQVNSGTSNVFINPLTFDKGSILRFFNNTGSRLTITQNTGTTIYYANTSNSLGEPQTGNRFISHTGYVTLTSITSNTFVITGSGIT